jgi:hypothetical protein
VDISANRTIIIAASVLPVTGLQFSASEAGATVLLKWSTYTEINNSHFEIWRSVDGRNFQKTGIYMAPDGNSVSTRNYQFIDSTPAEGVNYCQLKQYDLDGHFTFSNIVKVDRQRRGNGWIAYPNPVMNGGNINLAIHSIITQKAHLVLTNSAGQRVWGSDLSLPKGTTTYRFSVGNLPAGTYYLALYETSGAMITNVKKIEFK